MTTFIAWDIEIAKTPTTEDWQTDRPLGISCAAARSNKGQGKIFYGGFTDPDQDIQAQMSKYDCNTMLHYLMEAHNKGCKIVTWNGLGFDFDILAEESGNPTICKKLALQHYDPMFQFFCYTGYPVSLQAVSDGLGFEGKTQGVSGAAAPQMWADGQYGDVLQYVCQDVKATLQVVMKIIELNGVRWITRKGRRSYMGFPDGLLTVEECLSLPKPNTRWMDDPIPREKFTGWMSKNRHWFRGSTVGLDRT